MFDQELRQGWRRVLLVFGVLVASMFGHSRASAQTTDISIQTDDGWTFYPGFFVGRVLGFIAAHDPATVPAHTFSTIWFQKQADGTFSWEGWEGVSAASTAAKVSQREGLPDMFAQPALQVTSAIPADGTDADFVPMTNGVAADSVFVAAIPQMAASDVESLVEAVAQGAVTLTASAVMATGSCGVPADTIPSGGVDAYSSQLQTGLLGMVSHCEYIASATRSDVENGGNNSPAALFCIPSTTRSCYTTTTCGAGTIIANGQCKYTCTDVVVTVSVYVNCWCVASAPATTFGAPTTRSYTRAPLANGSCP